MKYSEEEVKSILTERVERHLRSVTDTSGLPKGEESLRRIRENWLEKRMMFEEQTELLGMGIPERFEADDPRGIILLTYSGSLIALGTLGNGGRWFEYASIKLRNDVPGLVKAQGVSLGGPVSADKPARFDDCPIERSSDILLLATCPSDLSRAEEEKRLREATIFLTNGFVKLNRTLTLPSDTVGHFTMKSMVQYLAAKNDISQTLARQVLDDYLTMVEAGLLLGERVPLGTIGKLHMSFRPAQKARIGRNPATGAEMTIPAKPKTAIPRMSFSARTKDRSAAMPVENETEED
jgi:nucleoid DNA-binding protein